MNNSTFIVLFFIISLICCSEHGNCVKKLSQDQINAILDAHNTYRNLVASGNQSSAGGQLPSASDMKVLEWSTELEEIAQNWVETNPKNHNPNRIVANSSSPMNGNYIGENMFWGFSFPPKIQEPGNYSVKRGVDAWFQEVNLFKMSIEKFHHFGPITGHFTQVIWAKTTKIGCGILDCITSEKYGSRNLYKRATTVVCNYWIGGNIVLAPIYKKGVPCSSCVCSKKYTSLCI